MATLREYDAEGGSTTYRYEYKQLAAAIRGITDDISIARATIS